MFQHFLMCHHMQPQSCEESLQERDAMIAKLKTEALDSDGKWKEVYEDNSRLGPMASGVVYGRV